MDNLGQPEQATVVNLTEHEVVTVHQVTREVMERLPRSPKPLRIKIHKREVGKAMGAPVYIPSFDLTGDDVPPQVEGTLYVVSKFVKEAYPERVDFIVPSRIVKIDDNKMLACMEFLA